MPVESLRLWTMTLVVCLLAACGSSETTEAPAPIAQPSSVEPKDAVKPEKKSNNSLSPAKRKPLASPKALLKRPRTRLELPTTSYDRLMTNLESQLSSARKLYDLKPDSVSTTRTYASHKFSMSQVSGDLAGMDASGEMVTKVLEKKPGDVALHLLRARVHFALHRWDAADKDLAIVRKAKPDHGALPRMEAEFLWNQGKVKEARQAIEAMAKEKNTWSAHARLAALHFALGDYETADNTFAKAETLYRDTSPVPLAWLYVQRGLLRLHTGRFEEAKVFYEAAVERAAGYPMAVEHLAEIEMLLGNTERAKTLYESVVKATDNPEFHIALAGVHEEQGDKAAAKASRDRARARNLRLIERFPAAMSGHGADFFLEEGEDHKVALSLLTRNAKDRPNADSFQALAEAQLANGKTKEAKTSIDKALASEVRRAEIFWTAARVAHVQKQEEKSQAFKAKALKLNPKIATLEGDI